MSLKIPPSGSRGVSLRAFPVFRAFNKLNVAMYRRSGGKSSGRAGLLLTTIGARSGQERTVALGSFPEGEGRWLVVATLAGAARHPAWLYNLAKNPDKVWVEIGKDRWRVTPEILGAEERPAAWERIAARAPGYAKYQTQTDREIPIVRLTRAQ
jgi:deazaflavin-dependent oxidoreductase (nitroreductase family)